MMKFVCNKLGLITVFYVKMFGNKSLHFLYRVVPCTKLCLFHGMQTKDLPITTTFCSTG